MTEIPLEIRLIKRVISNSTVERKLLFMETTKKFFDTFRELLHSDEIEKASIFHMALAVASFEISEFMYERMKKTGMLEEIIKAAMEDKNLRELLGNETDKVATRVRS